MNYKTASRSIKAFSKDMRDYRIEHGVCDTQDAIDAIDEQLYIMCEDVMYAGGK